MIRFLLILSLVIQQLMLSVVASAVSGPTGIDPGSCQPAMTCCSTTERLSCCGERIVESYCASSDGVCRCGITSENAPALPESSRPHELHEGLTLLVVCQKCTIVLDERQRAGISESVTSIQGMPRDAQALLCRWRT